MYDASSLFRLAVEALKEVTNTTEVTEDQVVILYNLLSELEYYLLTQVNYYENCLMIIGDPKELLREISSAMLASKIKVEKEEAQPKFTPKNVLESVPEKLEETPKEPGMWDKVKEKAKGLVTPSAPMMEPVAAKNIKNIKTSKR